MSGLRPLMLAVLVAVSRADTKPRPPVAPAKLPPRVAPAHTLPTNHPLRVKYGSSHPLPFHMPAGGEQHLKLLDVLYDKDVESSLPPMRTLNDIPASEVQLLSSYFRGNLPWKQTSTADDHAALRHGETLANSPPVFPSFYNFNRQRSRQSLPPRPVAPARLPAQGVHAAAAQAAASEHNARHAPVPSLTPPRSSGHQKRDAPFRADAAKAPRAVAFAPRQSVPRAPHAVRAAPRTPQRVQKARALPGSDIDGLLRDSGEVFKLSPADIQAAVARADAMTGPIRYSDFQKFTQYTPLRSQKGSDLLYIRGSLLNSPARDLMFEDTLHLENSNRVSAPNQIANDFSWVRARSNDGKQLINPKMNFFRYRITPAERARF